jgi:hypothetical protein
MDVPKVIFMKVQLTFAAGAPPMLPLLACEGAGVGEEAASGLTALLIARERCCAGLLSRRRAMRST